MEKDIKEKWGYIRVSDFDQDFDRQIKTLKEAGCTRIFADKCSGDKEFRKRKEGQKLWSEIHKGVILIIHDTERAFRNMLDEVQMIDLLCERGIIIKCATEPNYTNATDDGIFFMHINGAFSAKERKRAQRRALEAAEANKAKGKFGGRPNGLSREAKIIADDIVKKRQQNMSVRDICKLYKIAIQTYYNYLGYKAVKMYNDGVEENEICLRLFITKEKLNKYLLDDLKEQKRIQEKLKQQELETKMLKGRFNFKLEK